MFTGLLIEQKIRTAKRCLPVAADKDQLRRAELRTTSSGTTETLGGWGKRQTVFNLPLGGQRGRCVGAVEEETYVGIPTQHRPISPHISPYLRTCDATLLLEALGSRVRGRPLVGPPNND